jgi:4'-phosphopantetheinyl transferase
VEVWRAHLSFEPDRVARLSRFLDQAERERAARFHFDRDRGHFVVARALLRQVLGRHLGEAPEALSFGYSPQGKPFLRDRPDLHFNLSHAGDRLMIAVSLGGRLGIDVEQARADDVVASVSPLVFSGPERRLLERLDPEMRRECFTRFWTRKESYIKADGRGMSLPLRHIDVGTSPGRVLLLDEGSGSWSACLPWTVHTLPAAPGYAGALTCEEDAGRPACFDWRDGG